MYGNAARRGAFRPNCSVKARGASTASRRDLPARRTKGSKGTKAFANDTIRGLFRVPLYPWRACALAELTGSRLACSGENLTFSFVAGYRWDIYRQADDPAGIMREQAAGIVRETYVGLEDAKEREKKPLFPALY